MPKPELVKSTRIICYYKFGIWAGTGGVGHSWQPPRGVGRGRGVGVGLERAVCVGATAAMPAPSNISMKSMSRDRERLNACVGFVVIARLLTKNAELSSLEKPKHDDKVEKASPLQFYRAGITASTSRMSLSRPRLMPATTRQNTF